MNTPEVSVVMSVYNGAEHLQQTLRSILSQEGCELEFVVVDDGSIDDTGRILDEWAARDNRLRVIHQGNTGLTRALIRGCAEARGEFIARQDAGDISLPGRLKEQICALSKDNDLAFVSCKTQFVGPEGEYLYQQAGTGLSATPINIIDIQQPNGIIDGPSSHPSVTFRKRKYLEAGGYRPQFYFGQDWDLWYRLGMIGKFLMLPSTLYEARVGLSDISTSNKRMQEELAELSLQSLRLRVAGQPDTEILHQASQIRPQVNRRANRGRIAKGAYFLGECLRRNGDVVKARHYFWQSLKDRPLQLKAWVRLGQTILARHQQ
ncbi:Putative glycosyltransferase EpsE [Rhodocyclaceae bacterium]|nr:Putative glycosyltransferase EpsE [Rhodocyclaceae bacterium]